MIQPATKEPAVQHIIRFPTPQALSCASWICNETQFGRKHVPYMAKLAMSQALILNQLEVRVEADAARAIQQAIGPLSVDAVGGRFTSYDMDQAYDAVCDRQRIVVSA